MTTSISREHIAIVEGASGPQPRIVGSRIRVVDVAIWYEQQGLSVDEIVEQHPTINKADVFAALAYYWDHREEITQLIADEDAEVAEFLKTYVDPVEAKQRASDGSAPLSM